MTMCSYLVQQNAKNELHNFLNKDLHFKDIKIDIESVDKMTDNEKDAFMQNHFKSKVQL